MGIKEDFSCLQCEWYYDLFISKKNQVDPEKDSKNFI